MNKKTKTETWVGLFLLAGLILATAAVLSVSSFKTSSDATYPIRIMYKDAAGLIKGSQLRLGGAFVGEVVAPPELTETGNRVIVKARINKNVRIQAGSEFRIDMQNLLGDKYIDIVPPEEVTNQYLPPDSLVVGQAESDLNKIKNNAVQASQEVVDLLRKIDANSDKLDEAIADISAAAKGLAETTKRLNEGFLSDENAKHVTGILKNANEASAKMPALVDEVQGSLASLNETMADVRKVAGQAGTAMERLDPALQAAGPTMESLNKSADDLSKITRDVRQGRGTLGLLLYDQNFRTQIDQFGRNLRDYGILRYRNPNEPQKPADPRSGYSGQRR